MLFIIIFFTKRELPFKNYSLTLLWMWWELIFCANSYNINFFYLLMQFTYNGYLSLSCNTLAVHLFIIISWGNTKELKIQKIVYAGEGRW